MLALRRPAAASLHLPLLLLLAASDALAQPAAPPEPHGQRASQLIVENHLSEACDELMLAYEASHEPLLLLRVGRLRQRLGQKDDALAAYRRFLAEAKEPHPGLKAEALDAIRELAPLPPPPPVYDGPPPQLPPPPQLYDPALGPLPPQLQQQFGDQRRISAHYELRRSPRLMKIGALLFSAGYLPALVVPLGLSGSLDMENAPNPATNYTVMIPLLGPLISGIIAPATNQNGHGAQVFSSWSAPWLLTSGLLQGVGFALLVYGAVRRPTLVEDKVQATPPAAPRVSVLPWLGPGGGGLALEALLR